MPQNQDVNWIFSRAFLASLPMVLAMVYFTLFEREGLLLETGNVVGRDFVNYWLGGSVALKGLAESLFSFDKYIVILRETFGPEIKAHNWSYPPHFLMMVVPFGALPYLLSLFCWSLLGMACYLVACQKEAWRLDDFLILALAPAGFDAIFAGQNGLFTAALFVGGLRLSGHRPVLAGICFGLLTIKPQLGLLLPFALLASRQWTVIASACVTAAAAILLSGLLFGVETWWLYLTETLQFQTSIMKGSVKIAYMMSTVFMSGRVLGLDADTALLVHMPFVLLAVGAVIWAYSQKRDPMLQHVVLIAATFVATPYSFYYDMPVLAYAALLLARHMEQAGRPTNLYLVPALMWLWPAFGMSVTINIFPIGPAVILGFFGVAVRELYLAGDPAKGQVEPAPAAQQA
ncbi:MAG: DUF2029 domain-containing protein [Rhizobiales bacterium]|nr:DUF2029 domain-containing protein [Hyphomicrobiales bacterium]